MNAVKVIGVAALIGLISLGGPTDERQRDQLCLNQAYASMHAEECADAVHPSDWD